MAEESGPLVISDDKSDALPTKAGLQHVLTYRPDIDGLRTVAVFSAILFHCDNVIFPWGYTGVDIFFVISGYLITGILLKQSAKSTFTYADFYSRRIRRIFPTLLLVIGTSVVLGLLLYPKPERRELAFKSFCATVFGVNFAMVFTEESSLVQSKFVNPLEHFWSLSVEEQYYIFWPFVVALLVRLRPVAAVAVQLVLFAIFFGTHVLLYVYFQPPPPIDLNFYQYFISPSRFWNMSAGGLLAYATFLRSSSPWIFSPCFASFLSLFGMLLLAIPVVLMKSRDETPGLWTVFPVFGTVLLILAGMNSVLNKYVLATPPFVFLGKISYALYMWHYPLLHFVPYIHPTEPQPVYLQPYSVVAFSILLSIPTVKLLEDPIRIYKPRLAVPLLALGMVITSAASLAWYIDLSQ
ncbi:Aste57867_1460 [Aphanomyces stellatus]|uniref:Aste57867_1460 protein n=1 Tax=Aphanomyces stellatus TaxID=120398 RepID=A0A485K6I2_9STRA|nr:hypothetical protein As57867_001459 [Aphanomyces stellatus]VFT78677.1 Aste57867_1460 [Aphanomyces stellatus]